MPIRIYALAKQLNLDSKSLVDICAQAGVSGKGSALASLSDEEVDKVKAFLASGSSEKPAAKPPADTPLGRLRGKRATAKPEKAAPLRPEDYIAPTAATNDKIRVISKPRHRDAPRPADTESAPTPPRSPEPVEPAALTETPPAQTPPSEEKPLEPVPVSPAASVEAPESRAAEEVAPPEPVQEEPTAERDKPAAKKPAAKKPGAKPRPEPAGRTAGVPRPTTAPRHGCVEADPGSFRLEACEGQRDAETRAQRPRGTAKRSDDQACSYAEVEGTGAEAEIGAGRPEARNPSSARRDSLRKGGKQTPCRAYQAARGEEAKEGSQEENREEARPKRDRRDVG